MELMELLYCITERAAMIAREIRQEPHLMSLLIEEKSSHDFKTLADVLIQEMYVYYISEKFPSLAHSIKGEESNTFTNTLGESITVSICETEVSTSALLAQVLNGDKAASDILAKVVHKPIIPNNTLSFPNLDLENVGIWIDPIDSTAEYISGKTNKVHDRTNIHESGLECVSVLVGLYDKCDGLPVAAVVSRPFGLQTDSGWQSITHWGTLNAEKIFNSSPLKESAHSIPCIVLSATENPTVSQNLAKKFKILNVNGAGYKCLVTALGYADAYVCSKDSTYRWDTNGPHSLLRIENGGIISFLSLFELGVAGKLTSKETLLEQQILYHKSNLNSPKNKLWCNLGGIIAYKKVYVLESIYETLKDIDISICSKHSCPKAMT